MRVCEYLRNFQCQATGQWIDEDYPIYNIDTNDIGWRVEETAYSRGMKHLSVLIQSCASLVCDWFVCKWFEVCVLIVVVRVTPSALMGKYD